MEFRVSSKKLMKNLQESKFVAVLADAIVPCGELLAELFNIPFSTVSPSLLATHLKSIVEDFYFHLPKYLLLCQN